MSQERSFLEGEGDAYFRRNLDAAVAAAGDDPVLAALHGMNLGHKGALLDVGGSAGRVAAGFLREHPGWLVRVVEPSGEAVGAGRKAFRDITFHQGSITEPLPDADSEGAKYDVVLVSAVLHWVDRGCLSRAIANTDVVLADGGLLVLSDFDAPYPRANPYQHRSGLYTYKQDYAACFLALGIYHLEYRRSRVSGSVANPSDPYDRQWMTAVLRKDLRGRYATGA